MTTAALRRTGLLGVPVGAVVLLFALATRSPALDASTRRVIDNLGLLLAAAAAAAACGWRAHRLTGREQVPWWWLAAATGSWALGQTIWSYYEHVADRETPFPSFADVGFLLFSVCATVALLLWPSQALQGTARWRTLLDGVLIAGALFALSWQSALGAVVEAGGDDLLGYVVSIAYPVQDLVLLTLTVVVAAHARRAAAGAPLALLAAGLVGFAVADSGFAYLTAQGTFESGSPVDTGWFAGFLLIALAAVVTTQRPEEDAAAGQEAMLRVLLPYVPAALALALVLRVELSGHRSTVVAGAAAVMISALFGRQLLAVLENRRLVQSLLSAQAELRHQAFHDPLTGLANRALFTDRLRHGLALHARDLRPLSVLYCDLDGFKAVNDGLGHEAGDEVLRAAAERLRAATRDGDTVARMGGDEFALLLEDGGQAMEVAQRILAAFARPTHVGRHEVDLGVSIGLADLGPGAGPVSPDVLLQRADAAMYRAKRSGKGRVVSWRPEFAAAVT